MDPAAGGELAEQALQRFFTEAKLRANLVGAAYVELWEALERAAAGGARSRPKLVLLAYGALGGRDMAAAAGLAASYELLHSALLVHDDVIDRDLMRRGVPNVSGSYRNRALRQGAGAAQADHAGACAGILAGDLALAGAYRLLRSIEVPGPTHRKLHEVLDEAVFASVGGEIFDIEFSSSQTMPELEDIVKTARQKTSVYSFEAPLQAGAILAQAPEPVCAALKSFGRYAGIAYQLIDDVLGVFGEQQQTGKCRWGDLREGKRTALLAYAATRPQWPGIADLIGSPELTADGAERVRSVLVDCGAKDFAIELAAQHAGFALEQLEHGGIPETLRGELRELLLTAIGRVHRARTTA
ncbi:polyprenyl synthetase family protein [Glutamicibacter sp. 287]|uniref:polyprenyl synthetase family protein n=1 Tax=Glutamicibacter sp. 287 TaxID=3457732 RepID=UPI0040341381